METTLLKGLAVLEAMIARGKPCGVSELATELKLSKSNTHRLLNTLVAAGFATVDEGRYAASLKTWELGTRVIEKYDVRAIARPVMERVAKATSEGVRLAVLDVARMEVVHIDAIQSSHAVRTFTEIGERLPVHCTSSGKALLAYQDEQTIERSFKHLTRLTRWTITDPKKLLRHLANVRRDGFVMNLREFSEQVLSVAAPIFAPDGSVIASISIAAPIERMPNATLQSVTRILCDAAAEISAAMRPATKVIDLYARRKASAAAKPAATKTPAQKASPAKRPSRSTQG